MIHFRTFSRYFPCKVELFNVAAGDRNTRVSIKESDLSSAVSEQQDGGIVMVTLDDLLKDKGKIDYLKADIEGYEIQMLKGAKSIISTFKPKIAVTCYHGGNDPKEMIEYVKGLVPEYKCKIKGITQFSGKPVMIHFWL